MDFLRQWAVSLIISSAAVTAVIILTPRGSTDKTVKAVASLFVISVIFAPFAQTEFELPVSEAAADYCEAELALNEAVLNACRNAVEKAITQRASELNAEVGGIFIDADINTDGCIIIQDISVAVSGGEYDLQRVSEELSEAAGVRVTVLTNE